MPRKTYSNDHLATNIIHNSLVGLEVANRPFMRVFWLFRVECGGAGVGRGLRVEVEVLDDERTSTLLYSKTSGGVWPYLLLLCVA